MVLQGFAFAARRTWSNAQVEIIHANTEQRNIVHPDTNRAQDIGIALSPQRRTSTNPTPAQNPEISVAVYLNPVTTQATAQHNPSALFGTMIRS